MTVHWSVDHTHNHHAKSDFTAELLGCLARAYASGVPSCGQRSAYAVLVNYSNGARRAAAERGQTSLAFGSASIERRRGGGHVRYEVHYNNDSSGEQLELEFAARDAPLRPLTDSWRIHARNNAGDHYKCFTASGYLHTATDSQTAELTVDCRLTFEIGRVQLNVPLVCNWALFDAVGAIAHGRNPVEGFAILDDLEKLKPDIRVRLLGHCTLPLGDTKLPLTGCAVLGRGEPPTYWWTDAHGNVALMSTVYRTFVLKEMA